MTNPSLSFPDQNASWGDDVAKALGLKTGQPTLEVNLPVEMTVHSDLGCAEGWVAIGAGAAVGAVIGTIIFPGIGTAIGALLGALVVWIGSALRDSTHRVVVDDFPPAGGQSRLYDATVGGCVNDAKFTAALQGLGIHSVRTEAFTIYGSARNEVIQIRVVPIPLFFPVDTPRCIILSDDHPSRTVSGIVQHGRTQAAIATSELPVVQIRDLQVIPLEKDDYDRAKGVEFRPYDPATGGPNPTLGYFGGIFDAQNRDGPWSYTDSLFADPNDPSKGTVIPSKKITYATYDPLPPPDPTVQRFARQFTPGAKEEEMLTRIFIRRGQTFYDLHMSPILEQAVVAIPMQIRGNLKQITSQMVTCDEGTVVEGVKVVLQDKGPGASGFVDIGEATTDANGDVTYVFSSWAEGLHELRLKATVPATGGTAGETVSESRFVALLGAGAAGPWLLPIAIIALLTLAGVGGYAIYNAQQEEEKKKKLGTVKT